MDNTIKFGGKGASLLKLQKAGFNVPDFLIVKPNENNLDDINYKISRLKSRLYSVRSSATVEDGKTKSFAGQFKSFLNVPKNKISTAIQNVRQSSYSPSVRSYNNDEKIDMAVIVQKMIAAKISGVAFSIDSNSSTGNYINIELCHGLGDKLVSGEITPTKYIVRRETLSIDSIKGRDIANHQKIKDLSKQILQIEKLYKMPVDIEWCFDQYDNIYILQARPITSFPKVKIEYKKVLSRPHSLMRIQIYENSDYNGLMKITNNLYYCKPLFVYNKDRNSTDIFYNQLDLEEDPRLILKYLSENIEKTQKIINNANKHCAILNQYVSNKKTFDCKKFINHFYMVYPILVLGYMTGNLKSVPKNIKNIITRFRKLNDVKIYQSEEYLIKHAKRIVSKQYLPFINFMTLEEIFENKTISIAQIKKRMNGFVYFNQEPTTLPLKDVMEKYNIFIRDAGVQELIKGNCVYPGIAIGKVKIIRSRKDFIKFNKGDILVTSMTLPSFVEIMKLAAAIVTDEGGTTCHAAIIAKELGVPCIIGTKYATEILSDNNNVKVDANSGNVSAL